MTTTVDILNRGPLAVLVTPIDSVTGETTPALGEPVLVLPGQFSTERYVHAGLSYRIDEVMLPKPAVASAKLPNQPVKIQS